MAYGEGRLWVARRNLYLIIRENIKTANAFFARHPEVFEVKTMECGPVAFHKLKLDMPVLGVLPSCGGEGRSAAVGGTSTEPTDRVGLRS